MPAPPLRSRRPVSARSLRCGLRLSQSLRAAPSLRSVATIRRRTTALGVPRFVSPVVGRHRAAGLIQAAGIQPAVPAAAENSLSLAALVRHSLSLTDTALARVALPLRFPISTVTQVSQAVRFNECHIDSPARRTSFARSMQPIT